MCTTANEDIDVHPPRQVRQSFAIAQWNSLVTVNDADTYGTGINDERWWPLSVVVPVASNGFDIGRDAA